MVAYFAELARAARLDDPRTVAEQINLLHEGATAIAQITGEPDIARVAKALAVRMLPNAKPEPGQ